MEPWPSQAASTFLEITCQGLSLPHYSNLACSTLLVGLGGDGAGWEEETKPIQKKISHSWLGSQACAEVIKLSKGTVYTRASAKQSQLLKLILSLKGFRDDTAHQMPLK